MPSIEGDLVIAEYRVLCRRREAAIAGSFESVAQICRRTCTIQEVGILKLVLLSIGVLRSPPKPIMLRQTQHAKARMRLFSRFARLSFSLFDPSSSSGQAGSGRTDSIVRLASGKRPLKFHTQDIGACHPLQPAVQEGKRLNAVNQVRPFKDAKFDAFRYPKLRIN